MKITTPVVEAAISAAEKRAMALGIALNHAQLHALITDAIVAAVAHMDTPNELLVSSGITRQYEPFVELMWGELAAQVSPTTARELALNVLQGASAAESDALFMRAAFDIGGKDGEAGAAAMVQIVRQLRAAAEAQPELQVKPQERAESGEIKSG